MSGARARTRALLVWALVLLAMFVAMAVSVAVNPSAPWAQPADDAWRRVAGVGPDSALPASPVPMFFQHLGQVGGLILLLALLAGLLILGRWRSALFLVSGFVFTMLVISTVTKNLVDRPRPAVGADGLFGPLFSVDHGSFPSGHCVTVAFFIVGIAALLSACRPALRGAWLVVSVLLAVGMVWQRTLINAHWLSDTLSGLIAGVAGTLLMWWAFEPWLRRDHRRSLRWARSGVGEASHPEGARHGVTGATTLSSVTLSGRP